MKTEQMIILEDNEATANYLKFILNLIYPGRQILIFENLALADNWLQENDPKLALIDIGLPDGSGLDFLKALKLKNSNIPAVIITVLGDDESLFTALSYGADGYVLKDEDQNLIHRTLLKLEQGEPPLSASIALRLMRHFHKESPTESKLSPREIETLKLIGKGFTIPEVAEQLGLSRQTIAGYVKNIYQKLHISSRAEAAREALRLGYI